MSAAPWDEAYSITHHQGAAAHCRHCGDAFGLRYTDGDFECSDQAQCQLRVGLLQKERRQW